MTFDFGEFPTTDYGSVLGREHFVDFSIRPLWEGMKRISGPAYTVQLAPGDNLMLHAAIYEAPRGSIIVVDAVDTNYAVAGGNVCAVARQNGVQGFVIDGVIRDLVEIAEMKFPVYAKGVFPVPGKKNFYSDLGQPITCGGTKVCAGDIVVADIEGIVIIPQEEASDVYQLAKSRFEKEHSMSLAEWREDHERRITEALSSVRRRSPELRSS